MRTWFRFNKIDFEIKEGDLCYIEGDKIYFAYNEQDFYSRDMHYEIGRISPTESEVADEWTAGREIEVPNSNLVVAENDYFEIDKDGNKKTYFTWDEAVKINIDGWRLPTTEEIKIICAPFINDFEKDDAENFMNKYNFSKNGCYNYATGNINYQGSAGYYWESNAISTTYARGLYFSSTYLYPQANYSKGYGFSVKLVKERK